MSGKIHGARFNCDVNVSGYRNGCFIISATSHWNTVSYLLAANTDRGTENNLEIRFASKMLRHFMWFIVVITAKAWEIRATVSRADFTKFVTTPHSAITPLQTSAELNKLMRELGRLGSFQEGGVLSSNF